MNNTEILFIITKTHIIVNPYEGPMVWAATFVYFVGLICSGIEFAFNFFFLK